MTRYISNELSEPITSGRKDPRHAVIPPFSFVGELEIGISGIWYPTHTMELIRASLSCSGYGTQAAVISILKQEPGIPEPLELGELNLSADETKRIIALNDAMITPYDKIYLASWTDSGHTGVVVQMTGVLMS